jgi:hypothetical protein
MAHSVVCRLPVFHGFAGGRILWQVNSWVSREDVFAMPLPSQAVGVA